MASSWGESFSWVGSRTMSILSPWLGSVLGSLGERELEVNLEGAFHGTEENRGHWPWLPQAVLTETCSSGPSPLTLADDAGSSRCNSRALRGGLPAEVVSKIAVASAAKNWIVSTFVIIPEWCPKHMQVVDTEAARVLAIFWSHFDDFCQLLERPGSKGFFFPFLL